MNATTKMFANDILRNGYHRMSEALGEGGWGYLHQKGLGTWGYYVLYGGDKVLHPIEEIRARDNDAAINAFKSLYHLNMFESWEVQKKSVTFEYVTSDRD